jgi:dihydroflavonol-4-reductase
VKVLITGATGFLGSHLCRQMAAGGFQVTALHRPDSYTGALQGLDLKFRTGDLNDARSLADAVEGQDAVIHAAAIIGDAAGQRLYNTNVDGTRLMARICREQKVRRLVHVSSVSAIGIPPAGVVADERFPFNLENSGLNYHLSKKRAEEAVLEEAERGLEVVIVNPSWIFGLHGKRFRGSDEVYKVCRSPLMPYFPGGLCIVHVDDVVAGIVSALHRGKTGNRYILGGENLTYREFARRCASTLGLKRYPVPVWPVVTRVAMRLLPKRFPAGYRYISEGSQCYSSEKAKSALGYQWRPFESILTECVSFRKRPQPALNSTGDLWRGADRSGD